MKKYYLIILSIFFALSTFAQTLKLSDIVDDQSIYLKNESDLDFSNPLIIESFQYVDNKEVDYNLTINEVLVKNVTTETLSPDLANRIIYSSLPDNFSPQVNIGLFKKRPFATINFIPYIKGDNGIERITSYEVELKGIKKETASFSKNLMSDPSVLGSGTWHKIKISKDAIYKLDRSFLSDLGVDVDGLNPASLNVYGHPGGMLPIDNSQYLPGDPQKLAIEFIGDTDQDFESGEYFLFYGEGPHSWKFNAAQNRYEHMRNYYDDYSYFFIRSDDNNPKRISSLPVIDDTDPLVITSFDEHLFHEVNSVNLIKSGRTFFGEVFDANTDQNFVFSTPNMLNDELIIRTGVAAHKKSSGSSSFTISPGNGSSYSFPVSASTGQYEYARYTSNNHDYQPSSVQGDLSIGVKYNKGDPTNIGYLDYLSIQYRRGLEYNNSSFIFRESRDIASGVIAEFICEGNVESLRIWEVSDFQNTSEIVTETLNDLLSFKRPHDEIYKYLAFKNSHASTPIIVGNFANQDIHSVSNVDMVIVTHPDFRSAAQQLAIFHEDDNITSYIVEPKALYNEFSCGKKDPTAIKHFMKMLYDNAANEDELPRYLLLLGDASYDIRPESVTNYIFTYESWNSWDLIDSYLTDDYFGLLDDDESDRPEDLVDIGIGRFPVTTLQQANDIVAKIKYYKKTHTDNGNSSVADFNATPYGDWRNLVSFIADDEDSNIHMSHAEILSGKIELNNPSFNIEKIYFDAFQQVTTPGGERYPDVNKKIDERVQKGALILNYIGHGGEVGWAHERVLNVNTIVNWSNLNNMPLFFTATCEFARFDDPGRTSAGEYCILNPNGAAIALLSTTRLVYASQNLQLAKKFYDFVFADMYNPDYCLGDINMLTKRGASVSNSTNHRNFSLLGDPALRLVYPEMQIETSEINTITHIDEVTIIDTLNALSKVKFKGYIDMQGQDPTGFNATLYPTVFGKERDVFTLGNDGNPFEYNIINTVLFKGKASVVDGVYEFEFVVPKDISFQYGIGKVSYYMVKNNTSIDGAGYSRAYMVGGANLDAPEDDQGPQIELFLNEESFVSGSVINENPILLANIFDESGINTAGSGIGHDITAVIDGDTENTIVLNDFYEADLDTYTDGALKYQLLELEEGKHTLELKAWDVYNNSSIKTLDFEVKSEVDLDITNVLNYPNPFTTYTEFWFEHNQALSTLDVRVQVYTVSGRLVKTLHKTMLTDGYRSEPISWNGLDDFGDRLARGVYVYKLSVSDNQGKSIERFEKLVILN